MHYYQHHVGDYDRDTASLSLAEHGAYGKLMRSYYATERPLPSDADSLWRICGAMSRAERLAVTIVAEKFFQLDGTVLRHKRIDAEIAAYHGQLETASRAGRASAEARQRKGNARSTLVQRPLDSGTNGTPNGTSTNHEPVTSNQLTAIPTPRPAGLPNSVEQAVSMAEMAGVPADYAETIYLEHDGSTWEDGQNRPINNFASYIRARYNNRQNKHAREEKRYGPRTTGAPAGTAPTANTVYQVQQQIDAINQQLTEIDSTVVGAWGSLTPAKSAERRALVEKRKELRKKMAGVEERS